MYKKEERIVLVFSTFVTKTHVENVTLFSPPAKTQRRLSTLLVRKKDT
jgi:hypothetical protein